MKFKIVYDKPQRIRFRCGAYAFDKEYEGAIYNVVTASPYVNSAQVSSRRYSCQLHKGQQK